MHKYFNDKRVRTLKEDEEKSGPVIYWMQRDQRAKDNWALIYAQQEAFRRNTELKVTFCLIPQFLEATLRHYDFMIRGLMEVEKELSSLNIDFVLLLGDPGFEIPKFIDQEKASLLVTDFNPIKIVTNWKDKIAESIDIQFEEVDAHNIVPVWEASHKLEFAAYTIRKKINGRLDEFLTSFPSLMKMRKHPSKNPIDWDSVYQSLKVNKQVDKVDWISPGTSNGMMMLVNFIEKKLQKYDEARNDPNAGAVSNLSPYLHFGQISAQRAALEAKNSGAGKESVNSFLEELIVRRELSDNFCFYNDNYDSFQGFPDWAKKTLNEHRDDKREFVYKLEDFENASTHDDLWNAAQMEMVREGKMHGFMRMYWAKKILEWTDTPEEALTIGIYLNDKYELDGRDPNGYVGVAWSIGGVHDRAWPERKVYGKIRYMNYNGCKRKFNVDHYIEQFTDKLF
jgi:deoxyribodipyrimidine photo-lyase